MYNSDKTASRIKELAKSKGIKISEIMTACELNINTLSSMSNRGSWVQANSLAKIADYLDCSVDYLLCRTDDPGECVSMTTIERIIGLLEEKGIEQQQFASAIGVGKQKISEWKSGKTKSYMKYIDKIAEYLCVSTDYLLGNEETNTGNNITMRDVNGNHNTIGSNISDQKDYENLSDDTKELIELIQGLSLVERSKIIVMIDEMRKGA